MSNTFEIRKIQWTLPDFLSGSTITLYPYGLCIAGGALLALILMAVLSRKKSLRQGTVSWFAVLGIPLAVVFSRLFFFVARLDLFRGQGLDRITDLTGGGYLFFGAFTGLILAGWLAARITCQKTGQVLDAAAAPTALVITAARIGAYVTEYVRYKKNGTMVIKPIEIGRDILEWFDPEKGKVFLTWDDPSPLFKFPYAVKDNYGSWMFAVFFLEAVVALIIFTILLIRKTRRSGSKFLLFLMLYAGCQAVLETLRSDPVTLGFIKINVLSLGFVKANQVLAALTLLITVSIALFRVPRAERKWWMYAVGYGVVLLGCGVIAAMEFTVDDNKKILFLRWMKDDLCYAVDALAALGMMISTSWLIRRSDRYTDGDRSDELSVSR